MDEPPAWYRDWLDVTRRNVDILSHPENAGVVALAAGMPLFSSKRMAAYIKTRIRYRFDGPRHRIADVEECVARGYGACADGAAFAVAAFYLAGARDVHLCYETVQGLDGYAHARAVVGKRMVEPWPEHRRPEAKECSMLVDVLVALRS